MINVKVKLFAMAKDLAGCSETVLTLDDGVAASRVIDYFVQRNPRFSEWKNHLRLAVNSEYVDLHHLLKDGDEVAIIPPVSGG